MKRLLTILMIVSLAAYGCSDSTTNKDTGTNDSGSNKDTNANTDGTGTDTAVGDTGSNEDANVSPLPSHEISYGNAALDSEGCLNFPLGGSSGIALMDEIDKDEVTMEIQGKWKASRVHAAGFFNITAGRTEDEFTGGYWAQFQRNDGEKASFIMAMMDETFKGSVDVPGDFKKDQAFTQFFQFNRATQTIKVWAPNAPMTDAPLLTQTGMGTPAGKHFGMAGEGAQVCAIKVTSK